VNAVSHIAVAACLALLVAANNSAAAADRSGPARGPERGKRIFHGLDAVQGKVQDNGTALPAQASKCINCHSAQAPGGALAGSAQYLSATTLSRKMSRRGGPAYFYDQPNFCNTVRTGVDPAGIVLEAKMPRYQISDTQCADLWLFLSRIR
jgi:hypothetical protein